MFGYSKHANEDDRQANWMIQSRPYGLACGKIEMIQPIQYLSSPAFYGKSFKMLMEVLTIIQSN